MDITPKDSVETKALGVGQRISVALGIIITMATALLASVGGLQWITDHLALLGTGIASLLTGAITAYVAIRRMKIDKAASKTSALIALIALSSLVLLSGCLTRTRCLYQTFEGCTFKVNEPPNLENPSYPRSLQIGVQDQQVEGGTDTIASGNKTDPALTAAAGDSAIESIKGLFNPHK